ncbi:MAG: Hsp20/alpha crystallin family protein [Xenophilus sp.]
MYRSLFPRDLFAELDRLQRDVQQAFDLSPTIRGVGRGGFPALNVGATPQSIELYAFAPGLDPASIDVQIDRGVLSLSGRRASPLPADGGEAQKDRAAVHINERFAGEFRRTVSLPEDADPDAVTAGYRDGVLRVSVQRRASAQPRRITVQ